MWPFPRRETPPPAGGGVSTPSEERYSIGDPAFAAMLGLSLPGSPSVSEQGALSLSAVYRSVSIITGVLGTLPLRAMRQEAGDRISRVASWLDYPAGRDGATPLEWKETIGLHLLLNGNAFLQHVYNGAGALAGMNPVHPSAVSLEADAGAVGGKRMTVTLPNGTRRDFDATTMTHIPALSLDGLKGLSPVTLARLSLGTAIAGDRAAHNMFANGALISGLVTPTEDENFTEEEAKAMHAGIRASLTGPENAGDVAFINRKLKFSPWQLSNEDSQFLQSRAFSIEEVGRWYGIPPHLLGQSEKSTSWGTGLQEQNRGLAVYTVKPWTTRVEQRLSRGLTANRWAEFDYHAFLQPSPEDEIRLLLEQVAGGLLTTNEARARMNLPALAGGDVLRTVSMPSEVPA